MGFLEKAGVQPLAITVIMLNLSLSFIYRAAIIHSVINVGFLEKGQCVSTISLINPVMNTYIMVYYPL